MRKIKWLAALIAAMTAAAMLAGCAAVQMKKPSRVEGVATHDVTGSCDISISGDTITVSGETNLLNGAVINISVVAQNGVVLDSVTMTKTQDQVSQQFTMTSDKYGKDIKSVAGYITCAPQKYGKQPDTVKQAYGEKFEYINIAEGSYIWDNTGIIVTIASQLKAVR